MTTTTDTAAPDRPERRHDRDRPRVPITVHLRELTMGDGRKITIDRRSIGMICEADPNKHNGAKLTIVAFRLPATNPVPVREPYADLKAWWRGDANGKAA
jgi:hypothetical protein